MVCSNIQSNHTFRIKLERKSGSEIDKGVGDLFTLDRGRVVRWPDGAVDVGGSLFPRRWKVGTRHGLGLAKPLEENVSVPAGTFEGGTRAFSRGTFSLVFDLDDLETEQGEFGTRSEIIFHDAVPIDGLVYSETNLDEFREEIQLLDFGWEGAEPLIDHRNPELVVNEDLDVIEVR